MGLDSVELMIATEEEFRIEISNAEAERIRTVGELADCVTAALRKRGELPDETTVWERVMAIVVAQLGVPPKAVTRTARFIEDLGLD